MGSQSGRREEVPDEAADASTGDLAGLTADSRTVALWTLVSRLTGFVRVAVVAAILGPTYFGNLFQTANAFPGVVHELLVGSLITAILVPPLVRCVDTQDPLAARRLANGFLGVAASVGAAVAVLCLAVAPMLLTVITAVVDDPEIQQQQRQLGLPLLALLLPQIFFYGVIATGVAVQNAHRQFALPAAAPAFENLGIIVVMGASALVFGVGLDVGQVTTPQVLLLGIGSTAAVGLHAAAQWFGAYLVGVPLVPRAGWRDPQVRAIIRIALPSSGHAALNCVTFFGLLVVAGAVPGGAVAFQVGWYFFNLPIALSARPLAVAQLPRLSRSFHQGVLTAFHSTYRSSLALALFVAIPASLLFLFMPGILARAVSFGEMGTVAGIPLITAVIASLGVGLIGEAVAIIATSASYARRDALSPLQAMAIRAVIAFGGMAIALSLMRGTAILWTLGLTLSAANLVSAAYLHFRQVRRLPKLPGSRAPQLLGDLVSSMVACAPGIFVAAWLEEVIGGRYSSIVAGIAAIGTSGLLYLGIQRLRGSTELRSLLPGTRKPAGKSPTSRLALGGDAIERRIEPPC